MHSLAGIEKRRTEGSFAPLGELERWTEREFLIASHVLFAIGLMSLTIVGGQGAYVAIGLAACFVSAWCGHLGGLLSIRWSAPLAAVAGLWAILDVFVISRSMLFGLCHALVLLQAVKLLQRKRAADYWPLFLISLVELILSAAVTVSVLFAVVFPAYLIVATWGMILFQLRLERERGGTAWPGVAIVSTGGRRAGRALFSNSTSVAAGIFGLGLVIFLALPRVSLGLMSLGSPLAVVMSGFSSSVTLGDLGRMLLNPRVVMRVELPEPVRHLGSTLLWRGVVLDEYTGSGWRVSDPTISFVRRASDGLFHLPGVAQLPEEALLRQEVLVQGLDCPVLFGAFRPAALKGKFRWLRMDANGGLSGVLMQRGGVDYTVWSIMPGVSPSQRGAVTPLRGAEVARYLRLPPLSPRVGELARAVVQGAIDPREAADRLAEYLSAGYDYTLEPGSVSGADAVEDFLFRRRAGHCEYFASAMAVMLRTLGIPSRVVNGFRGAEWNSFGNYYVVRERNAHAWVEAFLPDQGWVTFDPTPPGRSSVLALPGFLGSLSQVLDTLRWGWHRRVIDFDASSQRLLAKGLVRVFERWRGSLLGLMRGLVSLLPVAPGVDVRALWLAGVALSVAGIVLSWRLRGVYYPRLRWGGPKSHVGFYDALLRALARRGYRREFWCTPRELAQRVIAQEREQARAVEEVTEMYYRVRYGGQCLSQEERRMVGGLLGRLAASRGKARPKGQSGTSVC